MSKLKALYSLASVFIVAGALNGCATASPGDEKITANVETSIDQHPDLGPPGAIQVQTQDHVVYLNGMVADGLERETAESIARQTPDVTKVVDSVAVAH
jgi:osmotically-inducible protein OsmY